MLSNFFKKKEVVVAKPVTPIKNRNNNMQRNTQERKPKSESPQRVDLRVKEMDTSLTPTFIDPTETNTNKVEDDLFSVPTISSAFLSTTTSNNAKIPSEEELETLNDFKGEVLTSSAIKISATQKKHCAYLENGWFVIDKSDKNSPYIASVRQTLKHNSHHIDRELLVTMPLIRSLYETHERLYSNNQSVRRLETINGQEAQEFQKEFLGLIEDAYKKNVSDIHVFVKQHETDLAFRINSELDRFAHKQPGWGHSLCAAAFAMAGDADPQYLKNKYQGARISNLDMPNLPKGVQSIRLQFSPLPGNGRYMVCRILKEGTKETKGISDLGYQKVHVDTINQMRRQSEGITVIAGPTGSGKSTTLVVMISSDMRDNPGKNVITVEDPPEYVILGAAQFAVLNVKNEDEKKEAFNMALGSALRSDPDTVMIGEIRDASSAGLAFKAALTGHRVYASLHANNAIAIMNRLRDIGVEIYNLTEPTLVAGLIGQRLMRNICPHCKIPLKDASPELIQKSGIHEEDLLNKIKAIDEAAQGKETYQGIFLTNHEGCSHCRRGIIGRATVAETIAPDEDFMEPIRNDKTNDAMNVWLDDHNGLTMQEHALQKMTKGIASPQDVLDVAGDFTKFDIEKRGQAVFGHLYADAK